MKDLTPKIKKALLKTLKNYYSFGDYTVYEKSGSKSADFINGKKCGGISIRLKNNDADDFEIKRGWDDQQLCWIPPYDFNDKFSFIYADGYMKDLMNPCYADYPNYEFEDTIYDAFEKVGLRIEPDSMGRCDVYED